MDPPFSENANRALSDACRLASTLGEEIVGTEHLVIAFCSSPNRALHWLAMTSFPGSPETAIDSMKSAITSYFDSRGICTSRSIERAVVTDPKYSRSLHRTIQIAKRIGSNPVRDGSQLYSEGLVASEFLLAALLVEGTGFGAEALTRCSNGLVDSKSLLEAIGVSAQGMLSLAHETSSDPWKEFFTNPSEDGNSNEEGKNLMDTIFERPDEETEQPTPSSNWLIEGRLIIGERPSRAEAVRLAEVAKVDTFVSLIGEYSSETYRTTEYPSIFLEGEGNDKDLTFIHFPIRDFEVAEPQALLGLVERLKNLICNKGSTVFIHCRGGHGRTGMVAIPLLSALYNLSIRESKVLVADITGRLRRSDKRSSYYRSSSGGLRDVRCTECSAYLAGEAAWIPYRCVCSPHMPETVGQLSAIEQLDPYVRKVKRGFMP